MHQLMYNNLLFASRSNPHNHRIRALPGNCWCKAW